MKAALETAFKIRAEGTPKARISKAISISASVGASPTTTG
jgi:hypothetical protein